MSSVKSGQIKAFNGFNILIRLQKNNMTIILYDNQQRNNLHPINSCRANAELRCGIWSVEERWKQFAGAENVFIQTTLLLQQLYKKCDVEESTWVDAALLCNAEVMEQIIALKPGEILYHDNQIVASTSNPLTFTDFKKYHQKHLQQGKCDRLQNAWHLFQFNDVWIREDMNMLSKFLNPFYVKEGNTIMAKNAVIKDSIINDETGSVFIGEHAQIMEGCTIRGPFAMGENAVLKMGTKIYGPVSLGKQAVVGGELKNVVIQSYSNKAHDGYLGDSVIGQWCNLGAGTINSNVKNDAGIVQLWNPLQRIYQPVSQKCGVIMGDYCRTAIQTTINTGTMIDTGCSVVDRNLVRKYLPPFVQGGTNNHRKIPFDKLLTAIKNWKEMKRQILTMQEEDVLRNLYFH